MSNRARLVIRAIISPRGRKAALRRRRQPASGCVRGCDRLEPRAMLAANDISVGLAGNALLLSLDAAGVQITDLHTAYNAASKALTITAARSAGDISMPVAIPGVAVDSSTDTIVVDLVRFRSFDGIRVLGGVGTDSIAIGPGGVNLSVVTGGGAAQGFSIDTGAGAADALVVAHPVVSKGGGGVSLTTLGVGLGRGIRLSAGVTTPRGSQTYAGRVTLADAPTLRAGGGIAFTSTVDGATRLTLSSGAAVTLAGAIGGTTPLTGLTLAAARSVAVSDAVRLDGTAAAPGSSGLVIGSRVNGVVFSPATPGNARTIAGFGGSGIRFMGGSTGSRLTNLTSTDNGTGLALGPGSYRGTVISASTFSGNSGDGVSLRSAQRLTFGSIAAGNSITSNGGFGIHARGLSVGTVVEGNQVSRNARGHLNGSGGTVGRNLLVPSAPGLAVRLSAAGLAATKTEAVGRFQFDMAVVVNGVRATSTGGADLRRNRLDVDVRAGDDATELRQIGNTIYVDARRLGATGTTWVAVDTVAQATNPAVRAVSGMLAGLSPRKMLDALQFPGGVQQLGSDASGTRYRGSIDRLTFTSLVPLFDMFDVPADVGPVAGAAHAVDVWVDGRGHVSRVVASSDDVSFTITLRDIGTAVPVVVPPAAQTGELGSTSGRFLFGTGFVPPAAPAAPYAGVTAAPTVGLVDGILRGALHASSATGQELKYAFTDSTSGGKLDIGTVPTGPVTSDPQSFTILPYASWLDGGGGRGSETFTVRVGEVTAFDRLLTGIPLVGAVAAPVLDLLQDTPLVGSRLAPLIGESMRASISVDVADVAPGDTPLAWTFMVPSFDGTPLSTNFFPASGLAAGGTAPTVFNASGLGVAGQTNPYASRGERGIDASGAAATVGTGLLRDQGYNVITWDPRGEFASGGVLQLDSPFFEGRDVSSLVTWVAARTPAALDGPNDPKVAMIGGSYGGGIQLIAASTDPRIDAIVPDSAWNSLAESLSPGGSFQTTAVGGMLASLTAAGVRVNDLLATGLAAGVASGRLSDSTQALLAASGPTLLLNQLQAPTLLTHSITSGIFPLQQALDNAQTILANPFGTQVKMIWYGAGGALTADEFTTIADATLAWLDTYVAGRGQSADALPAFQWFDHAGGLYASSLLPSQAGFNGPTPPISASAAGGTLTISPGTTPVTAIGVPLTVPAGTQVVGAPTISFTYQGQGTSRAVYARLVETATGNVLGDIVTPIPVTLDGEEHTVTMPLANVVFTNAGHGGASLTLQIVSAATAFTNPSSGEISISGITIDLPSRVLPP